MPIYKCGKCGKEIDSMAEGIVRCPVCAYKVLYKQRAPVTKTIKAR
jgi:DNA-directed RNA polymerase subunit RPC12/RpoP